MPCHLDVDSSTTRIFRWPMTPATTALRS
jgi:hypothetical protein